MERYCQQASPLDYQLDNLAHNLHVIPQLNRLLNLLRYPHHNRHHSHRCNLHCNHLYSQPQSPRLNRLLNLLYYPQHNRPCNHLCSRRCNLYCNHLYSQPQSPQLNPHYNPRRVPVVNPPINLLLLRHVNQQYNQLKHLPPSQLPFQQSALHHIQAKLHLLQIRQNFQHDFQPLIHQPCLPIILVVYLLIVQQMVQLSLPPIIQLIFHLLALHLFQLIFPLYHPVLPRRAIRRTTPVHLPLSVQRYIQPVLLVMPHLRVQQLF